MKQEISGQNFFGLNTPYKYRQGSLLYLDESNTVYNKTLKR